ncbi:MAG TPA: DUF1444 family protein [Candidatus Angelobacter sp.]|nr:DUF1444 family protein [Candidatus Angelobacter sp.]
MFPEIEVQSGDSFDQFRIVRQGREPATVFLENMWRQCRDDVESRVSHVERFLRALLTTLSNNEGLPDRSCIVPTIKDEGYFHIYGDHAREEVPFASEHLVGDLWIIYAIDSADSMKTLQKSHVKELGLDSGALKNLAINNLRRILPPVEQHGEGPAYMLTAGGDYVASLLLFDELWAELKQQISGDVLAAVPSRDVLLFTDSQSNEGIKQVKASIAKVMDSGGYLISDTILRRTADGWSVATLT